MCPSSCLAYVQAESESDDDDSDADSLAGGSHAGSGAPQNRTLARE